MYVCMSVHVYMNIYIYVFVFVYVCACILTTYTRRTTLINSPRQLDKENDQFKTHTTHQVPAWTEEGQTMLNLGNGIPAVDDHGRPVVETYIYQVSVLFCVVLQMMLNCGYGVASVSRLLKIIGLFRKRAL